MKSQQEIIFHFPGRANHRLDITTIAFLLIARSSPDCRRITVGNFSGPIISLARVRQEPTKAFNFLLLFFPSSWQDFFLSPLETQTLSVRSLSEIIRDEISQLWRVCSYYTHARDTLSRLENGH